MGSERGVANWDAAGVLFVLGVCTEEAAGESGDGAGSNTFTLYAGISGMSGCWMTGAEDVDRSFGSSENLQPPGFHESRGSRHVTRSALFTKQVAKPDDGVCTIFHELLFSFVTNILCSVDGEEGNVRSGEKILAVSSP
jgi:hypothetical protein